MDTSTITAWLAGGAGVTTPAIGTFAVAGNLDFSSDQGIYANNGITTFTVGRAVGGLSSSAIAANNSLAGNLAVGRIGTLTVGSWSGVTLLANTVGAMKVTGFNAPENPGTIFVAGDLQGAEIVVRGVTPTVTATLPVQSSIASLVVQHNIEDTSLFVPGGVPTLTRRRQRLVRQRDPRRQHADGFPWPFGLRHRRRLGQRNADGEQRRHADDDGERR